MAISDETNEPEYDDLENVRDLLYEIDNGSFVDAEHLTKPLKSEVAFLPNGLPDPATLTPEVLEVANGLAMWRQAKQGTVDTLYNFQQKYYSILYEILEDVRNCSIEVLYGEEGLPWKAQLKGGTFNDKARQALADKYQRIEDHFRKHCVQYILSIHHLDTVSTLNSNLFYRDKYVEQACKPLLMCDTVLCPEPTTISKNSLESEKDPESMRLPLDHVQAMLGLRSLALVQGQPQALLAVPPAALFPDHLLKQIGDDSECVFIQYIQKVFDLEFGSFEEAFEYFYSIKERSQLARKMVQSNYLKVALPYLDSVDPIEILNACSLRTSKLATTDEDFAKGVFWFMYGVICQVSLEFGECEIYGSSLSVNSESEFALRTMYSELSGNAYFKSPSLSAIGLLSRAIDDVPLLNVSDVDSFVDLYSSGVLKSFRASLLANLRSDDETNDIDLDDLIQQFESAVSQMRREFRMLDQKLIGESQRAKKELMKLLGIGSLSVCVGTFGSPVLGMILPLLVSRPSAMDILSRYSGIRKLKSRRNSHPFAYRYRDS